MRPAHHASSRRPCPARRSERGVVLIIALALLVVVMLIGIGVYTAAGSQLKQSANVQFANQARDQAEAGIGKAEAWLIAATNFQNAGFNVYDAAKTPYLYPYDYLAEAGKDPLTMTWDNTNSKLADTVGNQRYYIELVARNRHNLGSGLMTGGRWSKGCEQVDLFRLTARGTSTYNAVRVVQEVFSVPSC